MTLEPETLTLSSGGHTITFTGKDAKALTGTLPALHPEHPLRKKIHKILHLTEEIRAMREDIAALYNDAKGEGYNVAAMRRLIRIMDAAQDPEKAAKMREVSEHLEIYARQMGQPLLPGMV